MDAKHTPGPWIIHRPNDSERIDINAESNFYIAEVIGGMTAQEANAHLIAAAPDLLEALEGIASASADKWDMPYADFKEQFMPWARNVALAALKKAKGETK
jgi:hypothetical protein